MANGQIWLAKHPHKSGDAQTDLFAAANAGAAKSSGARRESSGLRYHLLGESACLVEALLEVFELRGVLVELLGELPPPLAEETLQRSDALLRTLGQVTRQRA